MRSLYFSLKKTRRRRNWVGLGALLDQLLQIQNNIAKNIFNYWTYKILKSVVHIYIPLSTWQIIGISFINRQFI